MTEVNYTEVKCTLLKKDGAEALGQAEDVLVTGDPEFRPLEKEININWLK